MKNVKKSEAVSWKRHDDMGDMVMCTGYPVMVVVVVVVTTIDVNAMIVLNSFEDDMAGR
jgi:hypothetical protein